ncbi:MAG: rhodanese-like domain-containing protein [Anaerolineales bacterium]|nr:rhodanese-like domain-containing protein [Anaerolineales bacterium]
MSFLSRLFGGLGAPGHPVIQPVEYKTRFIDGKEAHTLIDVRTAGEFASGYIPGAINIPLQELNGKLNKIPKDKPVIIYCASGSRSGSAANMLLQTGYTEVYDLGGISSWSRQGYAVKKK